MRLAAQAGEQAQIVRELHIRFGPEREDLRLDEIVVVDTLRKGRVGVWIWLDFLEIAGREIGVGAEAPADAADGIQIVARHQAAAGMGILLDAAIRQEVLREDHALAVQVGRQDQLAGTEAALEAQTGARRPGIAEGFGVGVCFGEVAVLIGAGALDETGGFLIEAGGG